MNNLDILMDVIVSDAMLDGGASPAVVNSRSPVIRAKKKTTSIKQTNHWTRQEDRFLQDSLGKMPLGQIAKTLGRSKIALKVRYTRQGYATPTNQPGWISLTRAARLLGVDNHTVPGWFRRGIIPGRYAFTAKREVVMINIYDLKMWATRPHHWPYFNVANMPPGYLRRLVEKAQKRWGDQWITTRQVADMYGLNTGDIPNAIKKGRLPAIQCPHIAGRGNATWANWFVKKSDALIYKHKYRGGPMQPWYTANAQAFLSKLVDQNKTAAEAAMLMKQDQTYLRYQMLNIRKAKNERHT